MAVRGGGAGRCRRRAPGRAGEIHRVRPRPQAARQARQDRLPGTVESPAEGLLPECWIPPGRILEARALLELYHDLRAEHTAWVQRIHAVLFRQGAPALGEGTLRTAQGLAALRDVSAACRLPGSCRSLPH